MANYEVLVETVVNIDGASYTVKVQKQHWTERQRSGRAYVWGLDDPADVTMPEHHTMRCELKSNYDHNRVICGSCIFDAAWDKFNRAIVRDQRVVLEAVNQSLNLGLVKMRHSRKAGCSCPCSPGWVVDGAYGKDIFISKVK